MTQWVIEKRSRGTVSFLGPKSTPGASIDRRASVTNLGIMSEKELGPPSISVLLRLILSDGQQAHLPGIAAAIGHTRLIRVVVVVAVVVGMTCPIFVNLYLLFSDINIYIFRNSMIWGFQKDENRCTCSVSKSKSLLNNLYINQAAAQRQIARPTGAAPAGHRSTARIPGRRCSRCGTPVIQRH